MTVATERQTSGPRGVVRALGALAALGVLVGAVPVVLVTLMGALPLDLGALAPAAWGRADDGRLLLIVIVAVAWAAWAVMVLSVGLETWAALRRTPTPTLPGLGVPQRWAAVLVTSVVVAVSPAAGSPAAASRVSLNDAVGLTAAVAAATQDPVQSEDLREPAGDVQSAQQSLEAFTRPANPTVSTQRHDTLWMLAERYLGAGERYVEIVELNRAAKQPDGRSLRDDGRIYPGWTLALPVDAMVDAERPELHHVVRGDTLWQIADEELGDASRYPEIVEANRGDLQPDGQRLADPDLILPGWVLEIPGGEHAPAGHAAPAADEAAEETAEETADAAAAATDRTSDGSADAPDRPGDTADAPSATADEPAPASSRGSVPPAVIPQVDRAPLPPASTSTPPASTPPASTPPASTAASRDAPPVLDRGTVDQVPTSEGVEPDTQAPEAGAPDDDTGAPDDDTGAPVDDTGAPVDDTGAVAPAVGGAAIALPSGGALAALLLAGLGAELVRRRRQFQRHRRPGERMPSTGPGALQVEHATRIAGGDPGPGLFERALVQLAEEAQTLSRPLPDVRLVRVSEESVILDLAAPAGPAIAPFVAAEDTRWMLSPALLLAQIPDRSRALPGLVTVGFSGPDTLLLNLESVGTLAVVGPEAASADVVRGLAAELALGPASGLTERILCLADPSIAGAAEAGGIAVESEPARVAAALTAVLAQSASSGPDADDPLLIVLCDQQLGVTVPRRSGCVLITAAPVEGAGATLVVHPGGRSVLLPEREQLTAQRLSMAAEGDVIEALRATDLPGASPADPVDRDGPALDPEVIDLREISSHPARPDARIAEPASGVLGSDGTDPLPVSEALHDVVPRVLLLGEVLVENAHGRAESTRLGRLAETAAFVLLNPGARPSELQGALWPGRRSNPQTCRQMVSRTRTWLGRTDSGEPYLMTFAESAGRLRLRDEVGSDWADFQRLAGIGLADPEDTEHLTQALALVRGRPFGAVASRELPWADLHINEMICLVTDVAHALARRHEQAGRRSAARDAALRGLRTESESEILEGLLARTLA